MAATVEGLRAYMVDPPDEDYILETFLQSAISTARSAGIPEFKNNAEYDLFIYALATLRYDNRGLQFAGSYVAAQGENARDMINSFVIRLRHAQEDEQLGGDCGE